MPRRRMLALAAFAAACRAAPPSATPPPPSIAVGGIAGPSSVTEPEPVALVPPTEVACSFMPENLQLGLAFDGEGPYFASVGSAHGTLAIATGPSTRGAFLDHAGAGIRLRGWVNASGIDFYARRPILFSRWLVPQPSTRLHWVSAKRGSLELRLDEDLVDGRQTTVTFHEPPNGVAGCGDVTLGDADEYDATAMLLRGRKGAEQHVRTGEPIPIAREPSAAPVADLRFVHADTATVLVVERRGSDALVVIDAWEPAVLYGWIPDAFFVPSPGRLMSGRYARAPTVRMGVNVQKDRRRVTCEKPVRIVAERTGQRAYVGEIDAGTELVFVVDQRRDGYRELELEGIYVSDAARLVADRAVLDACRPVTPPR